jgi:aspartate 1-decarboxylase
MLKAVRAKLHGIRVTGADLHYHGSITLDPEICREAGLYPLEFVDIWNKNSGQRISTYVIHGIPGSRCCIMNGAAARTCQTGDEIIICAAEYLQTPEELCRLKPHVLVFNQDNTVAEHLRYDVSRNGRQEYSFAILTMSDS